MPPLKLGPHKQRSTSAGAQFSALASITKSLDVSGLDSARTGAITVYRKYFQYQDINLNGGDIARQVIGDLGGRRPTYIELYNEVVPTGSSDLPRYVQFHAEALPVVHAAGLKLLGYSVSTGNWEAADWQYVQSQGFQCDALGVHEYWGLQGLTIWNALRHRQAHDWMGGNHPPFIVSETGVDAVEGGGSGWMATFLNGAPLTADQYIAMLYGYDQALQQDSYVLGGTIFTSGYNPPFSNFEIDPIIPALIGSSPPPPPPPPPPPGGGLFWLTGSLLLGVGIGLAALYLIEPGYSEAGPPRYPTEYAPTVPSLPPGAQDARIIGADEPVPEGYTVIGEWR